MPQEPPTFAISLPPAAAAVSYTCPAYTNIQQPSVSASQFDPSELAGRWYILATTEPTLPAFCRCGVNDLNVNTAAGEYAYTNTDICFNNSISVHIRGQLSSDRSTPGLLHENAVILNRTLYPLLPNFVFRVERTPRGALETAYTYACLGKLPPVVGREAFSFSMWSRAPHNFTHDAIVAKVAALNRSVSPLATLDLRGLRVSDAEAFRACGLVGGRSYIRA
jgi:hypothetical protein